MWTCDRHPCLRAVKTQGSSSGVWGEAETGFDNFKGKTCSCCCHFSREMKSQVLV